MESWRRRIIKKQKLRRLPPKTVAELDEEVAKNMRAFVLGAVSKCGEVLRWAPVELKGDADIVRSAVESDPHAWRHAATVQSAAAERTILELRHSGLQREHERVVERHRAAIAELSTSSAET